MFVWLGYLVGILCVVDVCLVRLSCGHPLCLVDVCLVRLSSGYPVCLVGVLFG